MNDNNLKIAYNLNDFDFIDNSIEQIKLVTNSLNQLLLDSIENQNIHFISQDIEILNKDFERIYNILNIDNDNNSKCYYFGILTSMINIVLNLDSKNQSVHNFEKNKKSYPLLLPVLTEIESNKVISGVELRKNLNINSSQLSNFMKRIEKFNYVTINKVGSINYYSLTESGKYALNNVNKHDKKRKLKKKTENILFVILDILTQHLKEDIPNTFSIIDDLYQQNIEVNNLSLLKEKVESTICARDYYYREKIKDYINSENHTYKDFKYPIFSVELKTYDDNEIIKPIEYNYA